MKDIITALAHCHEKGIVHRDVQPANIIRHKSVWKLTGFRSATTIVD